MHLLPLYLVIVLVYVALNGLCPSHLSDSLLFDLDCFLFIPTEKQPLIAIIVHICGTASLDFNMT